MRPRNNLQRTILALAPKLPALTPAQIKYGKSLFPATGWYLKKGEIWCSNCSHVYRVMLPLLAVSIDCGGEVCPFCGSPLHLEHHTDRRTVKDEIKLISYVQSYRGYMVIRIFQFHQNCERGVATTWRIDEIFQNWITDDATEIIVTRHYTRGPFHEKFDVDSPWTIGHHNASTNGCYAFEDLFQVSDFLYPRASATPILRRNGFSSALLKLNVDPVNLIKSLLTNPKYEWLVKTRQHKVLRYIMSQKLQHIPYEHALKLANRNGIIIQDAPLWFDYLDLLHYFHLDTHSPKYILHSDIKALHDRLYQKKHEEQLRLANEAKRKKQESEQRYLQRMEQQYAKHCAPFLGVTFGNDHIRCHVLSSVQEFKEEGTHMHHCVYANEYWNPSKHPDSLIISATDTLGKRIETVEINTRTWQIVQSRAVCNGTSPLHNAIIDLVKSQIPHLRSLQS